MLETKNPLQFASSSCGGSDAFAGAKVLVVVVSFRNADDVESCLDALDRIDPGQPIKVLVCENGGRSAYEALTSALSSPNGPCVDGGASPSPSGDIVEVSSFRLKNSGVVVHVGQAEENLGYGGGVNSWLKGAVEVEGWDGVWVLNPDAAPEPGALNALVECARVRKVGMVGSRVMEPGDPGHVCSRGLKWRRFLASTLGVDANAPSPHVPDVADIEARIDAPSGASFYVTRACIDAIGLMEDLYFLYFEDLEWGLRAKAACGVSYAYDSVVPHIGGSTIGSASDRRKRSKVAVYYEFRNRLTFVRRNHPAWFWWTAAITAIHGGEFLLVGASENFKMAMRAVWAGIRKETGRADHVFPQLADRVDGQCVQPEVS